MTAEGLNFSRSENLRSSRGDDRKANGSRYKALISSRLPKLGECTKKVAEGGTENHKDHARRAYVASF